MLYPYPIKDYKRSDRVGFVSGGLSPEIQFSKRSQVHNDLLILINISDVFQSGMADQRNKKHSIHIVSDDNGSSKQ